ncbi:MAG: hypothetical protein ACJ8CR_00150 [Roseiflexaceae bacterium]
MGGTRKRRPQRHSIAPYSQQRESPETRQTFDRLVAAGYTPEGARQLLAHVVVREIFAVLARGERYNQARFVAALHRLPTLPDAEETSE